ncbi:hypothetical protein NQ176_g6446 [Zarea fungicola]|uniref:Uncharacterized protein n=1 Tax=Zarea fungicola TaxID=93591 RepID=A0ACC1N5L4_9HYPO|nr:hypothetical protein NQ176_g6446 [Lecanicillium fungicola]
MHAPGASRLPKPTPVLHPGAKTDSLSNTPESQRSIALRDKAVRVVSDPFAGKLLTPSPELATNLSTGSLDRSSPASSQKSLAADPPSVDADSTQIVNMALNLSESRRLVSRRNVSRAAPPKLLPLPDSATTNDLRQQLKQQRLSSRNISPRPGQSLIPRQSSGLASSSPLHSSFHTVQDELHRYQFSASTLARAQKAKEQLELMAQYRKLLDVLPPLKPYLRNLAVSPPGSPIGGTKGFTWSSTPTPVQLGRKYNPLQYIRNRKVRARERKIIDGEQQGFGEVDSVKAWVEKCEKNVALQQPEDDAECMVPYHAAEKPVMLLGGDSTSKAARSRRPRVDWFIEPCDIIADAYWIEQDQNMGLIEDRLWRRIFPSNSDLSRPMSRETEEPRHGIAPFSPDTGNNFPSLRDVSTIQKHHNPDRSHHLTIERAKEKLHNIKDSNHWQMSEHLHGNIWPKRESASEYSESDTELHNRTVREQKGGAGIKSAQPGDLLHSQMLEMIAKENRDKDISELAGVQHFVPPSMTSPERNVRSKPGSRLHSRRGSFMDGSDNERRGTFERIHKKSPSTFRLGQQHTEEHTLRAPKSIDNDSSLPTSPELRPSRKATLESVTMELPAPWSRPGSPSRNQVTKHHQSPEARLGDNERSPASHIQDIVEGVPQEFSDFAPSANADQSLTRNTSAPLAGDTIKGHNRMGSLRLRTEDPNSGLRGIFKGPRIDTVLRGSVSRLGDILRKKDGSSESQEIETTDESDSEQARGRRRSSMNLSRRPSRREKQKKQDSKHFLDIMPQFQHAPGAVLENDIHKSESLAGHGTQSNESLRANLLKPPAPGLRSPSMSASPAPKVAGRLGESDISDPESMRSRIPNGVRETDRRLNAMLVGESIHPSDRHERTRSRQWSIVDQGGRQMEQSQLSRREMARMKTLVLSSGVKAMEINRRAKETHNPFSANGNAVKLDPKLAAIDWGSMRKLCPENKQLRDQEVPFEELYPLAARALATNIQVFGQRWKTAADRFTTVTGPELQRRVGGVRSRVGDDLEFATRSAVDEADEASRSLALDQPLRIKHVVDMIERMLRKRRRRLRWLRRGLWLSVEWLVVGFMWYVWFVVMILRIFLGIGQGVWNGIKWVLWLS